MVERKIVTIVWRQFVSTDIEIAYSDGTVEHVVGTHADAAKMAESAGIRLVSSPLGTIRWTEDLPSKRGVTPKRIGPWLSR